MRYFTDKHGITLQAPDHVSLADFPTLTTEDEVSWSWYLSQVKRNMSLGNPEHVEEQNEQRFWHAKYYGKAYMEIDRIGHITDEWGQIRHRGKSVGV